MKVILIAAAIIVSLLCRVGSLYTVTPTPEPTPTAKIAQVTPTPAPTAKPQLTREEQIYLEGYSLSILAMGKAWGELVLITKDNTLTITDTDRSVYQVANAFVSFSALVPPDSLYYLHAVTLKASRSCVRAANKIFEVIREDEVLQVQVEIIADYTWLCNEGMGIAFYTVRDFYDAHDMTPPSGFTD